MNYDDRVIALITEASQWVGVREDGGDNRGPAVDSFERAVGPALLGQPWCVSFLQYCVQRIDFLAGDGVKSPLPLTASVLALWRGAPDALRCREPRPGLIVLWRRWEDAQPTGHGHAGLVTHLIDGKSFATIEGNTGPGPGVENEGDGVYARTRMAASLPTSSMRVLGFLRAWPAE